MSELTSPSPPPRPEQRSQTHLLPSSIFSTPSLSSALPLPRPNSASDAPRHSSLQRQRRTGSSQRRRHTRSVTSSISHSSVRDGSLGDLSMGNYTIDLAQLGRKIDGAPIIGAKQARDGAMDQEAKQAVKHCAEDLDEDNSKYFDGEYSIDLGALGEGSSSGLIEDREPQRDHLPSEDDGPEDFTLNLEKWMRGTEQWKKKKNVKKSGNDHDPEGDQKKDAQAGPEEPVDESGFEPVGTSTPAPLPCHVVIEEGIQSEVRLEAPPLSRLNTGTRQEKAAEEVFDRIAALQAEVESMRVEEENRQLAYQALEEENERIKLEHKSAIERDQLAHNAVYEEHERLKQLHRDTQEILRQENEQLKQNYDDAIEQLQILAQDSPKNTAAKFEQIDAMDEKAAKELAMLKAKAEADQIEAETRIKALESELRSIQNECFTLRSKLESIQEAHNLKVKELNAELEVKKNEIVLERKESMQRGNEAASLTETTEQKDKEIYALSGEVTAIKIELDHAQEQLAETRRIVETAGEENDRLMEQNDRQADDITDLRATINDYASKERMAELITKNTKETQHEKDHEIIDKTRHEAALEALSQQHQYTLEALGTTHGKELQFLRSTLAKASQAMQKREAKLAKAHQEEVYSLRQEIAALKKPAKASAASDTGIEDELRSAIRVLSSKLEKANASVRSARAEAAEARRKAEDVRDTNAAVNTELEARFEKVVEAREREWRRRIALLFRDRDRLAKALMWQWGREEVGPRGPNEHEQGYRYKFVTK